MRWRREPKEAWAGAQLDGWLCGPPTNDLDYKYNLWILKRRNEETRHILDVFQEHRPAERFEITKEQYVSYLNNPDAMAMEILL